MEAIKKFFILLFGLLAILLVAYLLSISADEAAGKLLPRESVLPESQRSVDSPEAPEKTSEKMNSTAPDNEGELLSGDSIVWRSVPEKQRPVMEKPGEQSPAVVISGKVPLTGNPNSVFISAAQRILPAVVSIHSSRRVRSFDFFHHFPWRDEEQQGGEDDDIVRPGSGSGIIISEDGYVMTNYHVVHGAQELRVLLYDKREFEAQYIGGDPTTDVAVLKVDQGSLPAAYMGDSDDIQIGEWVMAVGNPLTFTSTVTAGIVSALGRNIRIINQNYSIENFIQTDAVINPGNSGGALINLNGEVIGINTAIATRTGLYQGYGFSIPINLARRVVDDLIKYGRVRRGLLGVKITPVDDRVAKGMGLSRPVGALVQGVEAGFPAEAAGLRQGDIIMAVDGEEVSSVSDLQIKIARHPPGKVVRLLVWRNKKEWEVDIELAEAPVNHRPVAEDVQHDSLKYENLGISVREMTGEEQKVLNVNSGLMIEEVASGSPAERAGAFSNSVLLSIDGKPVTSKEEFEGLLAKTKSGDIVRLKIKQNEQDVSGQILFVEVP